MTTRWASPTRSQNLQKGKPKQMSNNVQQTLVSRKLQLAVENGTTASGTAKIISRSLGNIAEDATITDIHIVATGIASLMRNGAAGVYVSDKSLLESIESD